uniref:Amidohydrolase-related domain-containing protein n=1 Tax=candidate division WOR-3 bacterium TaxID=2052148 RepID=A0A7C4YH31_UNCW3
MDRYVIGNGFICDGERIFLKDGGILVEGERIKKIGKWEDLKKEDCEKIDVKGRMIIPGILNAHHHSYSSLACGLKTKDISTFPKRLKNLWWKLDSILDKELIYYSTMKSLIDGIKNGTTMVFDHHASMGFIKGSLNIIKDVYKICYIKGVLSFEVSERSKETIKEQIDENISFYFENIKDENIKGLFGLHANFTLSDKTLKRIGELKPEEMGIHIHCGESVIDYDYCKKKGYSGTVHRLQSFNLLNDLSILAHCVHISNRDLKIIEQINPVIVSNPVSNANNRIGCFNFMKIKDYVLGSDGIGSDIIYQFKFRFFQNSQQKDIKDLFFKNMKLTKKKFFPDADDFKEGKKADIVVLDYIPVMDVDEDNIVSHLVFGVQNRNVFITISNGKILFKDGKITFIDEDALFNEIKKITGHLKRKFYA